MTGDRSRLTVFREKFIGTVRFGNESLWCFWVMEIMASVIVNLRVYYVDGLGHNLYEGVGVDLWPVDALSGVIGRVVGGVGRVSVGGVEDFLVESVVISYVGGPCLSRWGAGFCTAWGCGCMLRRWTTLDEYVVSIFI
ncbi:hypothetical protein Tco_0256530 [Tanacetum coccineum]